MEQDVGSELHRIYEDHGVLTAANIVEEATPKDSVLHSHFEWNNKLAAHEYRLVQARHLVAGVKITIERPGDEKPLTIRAFVNVADEDGVRTYMSVTDALADADSRAVVLSRAKRELQSWAKRFEHLEELAGIISAIHSEIDEEVSG